MLRRSAIGEDLSASTRPSSPTEQAKTIRDAADQFLQTLVQDRRDRVIFGFPKGQTPTAAKFTKTDGVGGGPGGKQQPPGKDISGTPSIQSSDGPHDNGPGSNEGHPGGTGMGPGGFAFVGEKYGESMWTNYPVSDVPRPGLRMGELASAERDAVHQLLRVVLSSMGYQKVLDIMAADQIVADSGERYAAGLNAYTIALFGHPNAATPWMLQFGGHHLGLNVTFVGDQAILAPLHTGILPARFNKGAKVIRGLGRENDRAFDLLATFTPAQLKSATIDYEVSDLLCGPGRPKATFPA